VRGRPTDYIDDRSSADSVLRSYINAINLREYVRAYSYWQAGAAQVPAFEQFQQGYANTQSVELSTGPVTEDAGAGQIYYAVPVTLLTTLKDGQVQTFVGCYRLHLGERKRPGALSRPDFDEQAHGRVDSER